MSSRNQAIVPAGGHIQEECGVFGLINRFGGAGPRDPAFDAYHAMYALQPVSYTHLDVYKRQLLRRL